MAQDDRRPRRRVPFAGIVIDPGMTGERLEEALGEEWVEAIEQDRDSPPTDTALLSEPSLAEDWLRPEEDEAWEDLR